MDRFNLEEEIMASWQTADDLNLAITSILDGTLKLTEDNVANIFCGIKELHNIRSKRLFNTFETMVENEIITNKEI